MGKLHADEKIKEGSLKDPLKYTIFFLIHTSQCSQTTVNCQKSCKRTRETTWSRYDSNNLTRFWQCNCIKSKCKTFSWSVFTAEFTQVPSANQLVNLGLLTKVIIKGFKIGLNFIDWVNLLNSSTFSHSNYIFWRKLVISKKVVNLRGFFCRYLQKLNCKAREITLDFVIFGRF